MAARPAHLRSWSALGTTCRVWLVGDGAEAATARAQARVAELEDRWSRFRPESDVSRLNRASGEPVVVHPTTVALVEQAVAWWEATNGLFDPTVLEALETAGYDRDRATGHGPIGAGAPTPGCAGILLDHEHATVQLPPGVRIDLGGIGKGHIADLLANELAHLPGGLIDLGGDVRVWGTPPEGRGWPIEVEDLRDGSQLALLGLHDGALATSTTLRRRWTDDEGRAAHHLIDPRTGRPAHGQVVTVSVAAGNVVAAEVLAKAAIVAGSVGAALLLLEAHGVAAFVVPATGPTYAVGPIAPFCWIPPKELH